MIAYNRFATYARGALFKLSFFLESQWYSIQWKFVASAMRQRILDTLKHRWRQHFKISYLRNSAIGSRFDCESEGLRFEPGDRGAKKRIWATPTFRTSLNGEVTVNSVFRLRIREYLSNVLILFFAPRSPGLNRRPTDSKSNLLPIALLRNYKCNTGLTKCKWSSSSILRDSGNKSSISNIHQKWKILSHSDFYAGE
jgi:hypothetical protein